MKCPNCGADNPEESEFCSLCYERLVHELASFDESSGLAQGIPVGTAGRQLRAKKKMRKELWALALFLVVALAVTLIVLLGGQKKTGSEAQSMFSSSRSGLSFSYPKSWEKKDQSYLKELSKGKAVDTSDGNEVVLLKRGDVIFRHLLVVSSKTVSYDPVDLNEYKQELKNNARDAAAEQGILITFFDPAFPVEAGIDGFGMKYTAKSERGPEINQLEAFILKGNMIYDVRLSTPLKGGGSTVEEARLLFGRIIETVRIGG